MATSIDELKKYFGLDMDVEIDTGVTVKMTPLPIKEFAKFFNVANKLQSKQMDNQTISDMLDLIRQSLAPEYRVPDIFDPLTQKYFLSLFEKMVELNNLGTTKIQPVLSRIKAMEAKNAEDAGEKKQ